MARNSRKSSSSKSGGSTLFGILIGLIFGLIAAVAVALFVTQVPMPFVDKASRDPATTSLPDARQAPDPNIGLYGKGGAAGAQPTGPPAPAPTPLPGTGGAPAPDHRADPIASLGNRANPPSAPPAPPPTAPSAPATPAPSVPPGVRAHPVLG